MAERLHVKLRAASEFDIAYGLISDHLIRCGSDVPAQECARVVEHRAEGEAHADAIVRARRTPKTLTSL